MSNNIKISIVIPSIGKNINYKNLNYLSSIVIVSEIIIVLPKSNINFSLKNLKKIRIIPSIKKGQVNQRILGFKNAKSNYILQLDDDVKIDKESLFSLIKVKKKLGDKTAIGPILKSIKDSSFIHSHKNNNIADLIKKFFHLFLYFTPLDKSRMGKISRSGLCYGVDPNFIDKKILEVEWIPGCCMLHSKKNLYLKNYFSLKQKAYCEDLIHSILLRKLDIKLYITRNSFAYTYPQKKLDKKNLLEYNKAFEHFIKYYNKNICYYIYKFIIFVKIYFRN